MKRFAALVGFLCLAATISVRQGSALDATHNSDDYVARIAGRATTGGGALKFLETLTDSIGARVTESPQSRAASELILRTLKPLSSIRDRRLSYLPSTENASNTFPGMPPLRGYPELT